MTRIEKVANEKPLFKIGLNRNYYVFCKCKAPLIDIVNRIGKSENSIYYREKYRVWAIRVKSKAHKKRLKEIFN